MRITESGGSQTYWDADEKRGHVLGVDTAESKHHPDGTVGLYVFHDWEGESDVVGHVALCKSDVFGLIGQLLEWASRQ